MKFLLAFLLVSNSALATTIDWDLEFKPSYILSDRELGSFGFNNSTAPTGASRDGSDIDDEYRGSFQMMQSNFGINISKNETKLVSRFDFVDIEKASPSFQLSPRLIELYVDYQKTRVGLQTDIFSPLTPKTYNSVGKNFFAGDVGYYRNQLVYTTGNHSFSIGQQAPNTELSEDFEIEAEGNFLLQYLLDLKYETRRLGFSLSYINLNLDGDPEQVADSKGINVFYQTTSDSKHLFKSELYAGSNLANAGYFALSDPSTNKDLNEVGGYLEYEYLFSEWDSFVFGYSKAEVEKRRLQRVHIEVVNEVISKGIILNEKTYVSHWHKYDRGFMIVTEFSYYNTKYNYADFDVDYQNAMILQFGAIIKMD